MRARQKDKQNILKDAALFIPRRLKIPVRIMLVYCAIYLVAGAAGAFLLNFFIADSVRAYAVSEAYADSAITQTKGFYAVLASADIEDAAAASALKADAKKRGIDFAVTFFDGAAESELLSNCSEDLTPNKAWEKASVSGGCLNYSVQQSDSGGKYINYYFRYGLAAQYKSVLPAQVLAYLLVPITLLLLGATGMAFSGGIMRPVRKITETTKKITRETLSTRLDEKQSQEELRELAVVLNAMLENLEQTFTAQDRFVSDAAHELRTPLAVIKGYSQLLSRWGSEDRAILKESLEAIDGETDSMNSLIERLLFLTRSTLAAPQKEDFFINELVEEVYRETALSDKGVHILSYGEMEAFNILANKAMLKQLIRILTENALKYTPAGGEVTFSCFKKDNNACVAIADGGIGIAEEDLPHIFERFYRADKARIREGGTGLGLSIAKKIIDAHGGEIVIESEAGKGTTAIILCPTGFEEEE